MYKQFTFTPNHAAKCWIHTLYRGFWHVNYPDLHFMYLLFKQNFKIKYNLIPTSNRLKLPKPYQIINLLHCSEFQTADNKVTSLSQYVCGSLTFQIYYESMVWEDYILNRPYSIISNIQINNKLNLYLIFLLNIIYFI